MYLLIILHIEHINVLDFDDVSDRNWWFCSGNLRIIFIGDSAQLFSAQGEWVIRLGQRSSTGQRRQRLVLEIIAKSERKKTGSVKGSGVTDSLESYQIYRLWLPLDISDNNIMTKRTTHREPSQYKDVILPVYIGVSMLKIRRSALSLTWESHTWKEGIYIQADPEVACEDEIRGVFVNLRDSRRFIHLQSSCNVYIAQRHP